jgi:hypothetical protein
MLGARLKLSLAELAVALSTGTANEVSVPAADKGWVRRPAAVLREALARAWATGSGEPKPAVSATEWLLTTHAGRQWRRRQMLVYPDVAACPGTLLLAAPPPPTADPPDPSDPAHWGWRRPSSTAAGDDWVYLDAAAYGLRGDAGERGGPAQVAGLYWEDGAGLGGDPDVALRHYLPRTLASVAPLVTHI